MKSSKPSHKLKFLRQSSIYLDAKWYVIDVYQCQECKKYLIIDNKTDAKLSLNGMIGEEI